MFHLSVMKSLLKIDFYHNKNVETQIKQKKVLPT